MKASTRLAFADKQVCLKWVRVEGAGSCLSPSLRESLGHRDIDPGAMDTAVVNHAATDPLVKLDGKIVPISVYLAVRPGATNKATLDDWCNHHRNHPGSYDPLYITAFSARYNFTVVVISTDGCCTTESVEQADAEVVYVGHCPLSDQYWSLQLRDGSNHRSTRRDRRNLREAQTNSKVSDEST